MLKRIWWLQIIHKNLKRVKFSKFMEFPEMQEPKNEICVEEKKWVTT